MKALFIAVVTVVLISACATQKLAPSWPDGQERPINAQPITKPAVNK